MKKEIKANNKGFSLVELIVVVAIMAVLMVVLAPAMLRYVEKTRAQKDDSAASEVREALELALADEAIYSKVNANNTITVTIAGNTGVVTVAGDVDNVIANDLAKTVGGTTGTTPSPQIKISSKDRKGKTCTIKAEYKSDRQAYVVSEISWATAAAPAP